MTGSRSEHPLEAHDGAAPTRRLRRVIVRLTIGSFSVAALLGITALLAGGRFGETEGRILLTTLLVGVVSVAVLCYLGAAGRRHQPVGVAGGVTAVVPFVAGLLLIWGGEDPESPWVGKTFTIGAVVAATFAQASLLLTLAEGSRRTVRRLLGGTLLCAAAVAVMVSSLVVTDGEGFPDAYTRMLGVVAILDVLGTVTVAALVKFGSPGAGEPGAALSLPAGLQARLEEAARAQGRSAGEVAAEAIEGYLGGLSQGRP